jgi:lysophospholipase L1-like esterase
VTDKTTAGDKNHPRRTGTLRHKLYLILFGLLFSLLVCEIFLRVIGYSYPIFYTTDYYRGIALRPGIEGRYQKEGDSYVRINSDGLRDREHAKTKPANTFRIAVLGDSYAEGLQLPFENTFCALLERKLRDCAALGGKDVEVVNFGVSGYGTAQELITLRHNVWQYSPDIVLLAFTTNNDVTDNARALKETDEIPYYIWRDGNLVEDDSFRETKTFRWRSSVLNHVGNWFRDHLRTIQLIHYVQVVARVRLTEWRNRRRDAPQPSQTPAATTANKPAPLAADIGIDNMIYREPQDDNWKEAWRVTEGLILQTRDEVRQHDAKFVVVTVSNAIQVYPDPVGRQNFMKHIGVSTVFYPNLRLRDFAQRQQIDLLDLAEPMQLYADQNKVFLHGFEKDIGNGHWNADGHRLAADLITQKLCQPK